MYINSFLGTNEVTILISNAVDCLLQLAAVTMSSNLPTFLWLIKIKKSILGCSASIYIKTFKLNSVINVCI